MALLVDSLKLGLVVGIIAAVIVVWLRRPREVPARRWSESEDGWPAFDTREPWRAR
jgi:hypothetical protein